MSRYVTRADEEYAHNTALFEIPDREGLYYEKPNWIDRYFRRGKALEDINPSQMVKMYDPLRTAKQKNDTGIYDNKDDADNDEIDNEDADRKYGQEAK